MRVEGEGQPTGGHHHAVGEYAEAEGEEEEGEEHERADALVGRREE